MTLPYDIARCAGERDRSGTMLHQCSRCARQIYSKPADCHPYVQPWREPHHAANSGNCPAYTAPQPTQTKP